MEIVKLPGELEQIANGVSAEKRNEVQTVLNQVFQGVSKMRTQLDQVVVSDENDKLNMKLANTIRLGVREVRLKAEKTFDAKRSEVQQAMLSFKTEDSLWLKAKQTMQILTKEIEETAKWKEETKSRFDAEQKELKVQQRIHSVSKFSDISRIEFENMSDETFEMFLSGIEKQYNDRIESEKKAELKRIENERLDKLENQRRLEIAPFVQFITESKDLRNMSDVNYSNFLQNLQKAKSDYEKEQEKIRIENEKLKAAKEKADKAAQKLKEENDKKLVKEKEDAAEKIRIEKEKADKLQKELDDKKAAEKLEIDKKNAEIEKQKKEAEKLAKAPVKQKLSFWVDSFEINRTYIDSNNQTAKDIISKFESFKSWAKSEIEKL